MTDIVLGGTESGMTAVPNRFIDEYLPEADGEYVKIYLILWRRFCEQKTISITELADILDDTEKDVLRALRYWKRKGLLALETDEKKELVGIRFLQIPAGSEDAEDELAAAGTGPVLLDPTRGRTVPMQSVKTPSAALTETSKESLQAPQKKTVKKDKHAVSTATRRKLADDEDFAQLVFIAGKYLGDPMSHSTGDVLGYLYGELGMSGDLLEYLVESCVDAGHKSIHYMETVALEWHEAGITTVSQAKEKNEQAGRDYGAVMRAFGLSGRSPAPGERKFLDRWFHEYAFSREIVLEACARTIAATHQPSFEYTEGILSDWNKRGVKKMEDINVLDEEFRKGKEQEKDRGRGTESSPAASSSKNRRGDKPGSAPNRFHNFDQVGYDYDAIVKELNS